MASRPPTRRGEIMARIYARRLRGPAATPTREELVAFETFGPDAVNFLGDPAQARAEATGLDVAPADAAGFAMPEEPAVGIESILPHVSPESVLPDRNLNDLIAKRQSQEQAEIIPVPVPPTPEQMAMREATFAADALSVPQEAPPAVLADLLADRHQPTLDMGPTDPEQRELALATMVRQFEEENNALKRQIAHAGTSAAAVFGIDAPTLLGRIGLDDAAQASRASQESLAPGDILGVIGALVSGVGAGVAARRAVLSRFPKLAKALEAGSIPAALTTAAVEEAPFLAAGAVGMATNEDFTAKELAALTALGIGVGGIVEAAIPRIKRALQDEVIGAAIELPDGRVLGSDGGRHRLHVDVAEANLDELRGFSPEELEELQTTGRRFETRRSRILDPVEANELAARRRQLRPDANRIGNPDRPGLDALQLAGGAGSGPRRAAGAAAREESMRGLFEPAAKLKNLATKSPEGFTFNLQRGNLFENDPGVAVVTRPDRSDSFDGPPGSELFRNFMARNRDLLVDQSDRYSIGGWFDKDEGKTFLEIVETVPEGQGVRLGQLFDQKGVFRLAEGVEGERFIPTGGTGEPGRLRTAAARAARPLVGTDETAADIARAGVGGVVGASAGSVQDARENDGGVENAALGALLGVAGGAGLRAARNLNTRGFARLFPELSDNAAALNELPEAFGMGLHHIYGRPLKAAEGPGETLKRGSSQLPKAEFRRAMLQQYPDMAVDEIDALHEKSWKRYRDRLRGRVLEDRSMHDFGDLQSFMEVGQKLDAPEWYTNPMRAVTEVLGSEEDADMFMRFLAATSNGSAATSSNITFAKKAFLQRKFEGVEALSSGRFPNTINKKMLEQAARGETFGGRKVQSYYKALTGDPNAVVVDMWMQRLFGLPDNPTDVQYDFVEGVVRRLAQETGETPVGVQASLWAGIKDAWIQLGKTRPDEIEPYFDSLRKDLQGNRGFVEVATKGPATPGATEVLDRLKAVTEGNEHLASAQGIRQASDLLIDLFDQHGFTQQEMVEALARAGLGAVAGAPAGAALDDENRLRGAAVGAGVGAGAFAGRRARGAIADVISPENARDRRLAQQAGVTDELTGLPNRRALNQALSAAEADPETAVIVFDANNFGQINKGPAGQAGGDRALQDVSDAIRAAAGEAGVGARRVFRRGGDEFVVLAPRADAIAIRDRAEELFGARLFGDTEVSISGTFDQTFDEADKALQARKADRKLAGEPLIQVDLSVPVHERLRRGARASQFLEDDTPASRGIRGEEGFAAPGLVEGAARTGVGGVVGGAIGSGVDDDQTRGQVRGAAIGAAIGAATTPGAAARAQRGLRRGGRRVARAALDDEAGGRFADELEDARPFARRKGNPVIDPDVVNPEDFVNLDKFDVREGARVRLEREVKRVVAEQNLSNEVIGKDGFVGKKRITHAEVREQADAVGLKGIALNRDARLSGAEMLAIRNVISSNASAMEEAAELLTHPRLSPAKRKLLEQQIDRMDEQNLDLLNQFVQARSQTGRDLNNLKILAKQSMDPTLWLVRAQKMLGTGRPMTEGLHHEILRLIRKGDREGLATLVSGLSEASWGEKAVNLWRVGLLTSPTTHAANLTGNTTMVALESAKDAPAMMFDRLLSLYTGRMTKGNPFTLQGMQAVKRGAARGVREAGEALKGKLSEEDLLKFDIPKQITYDSPLLNAYTQGVYRTLGAEDRLFRGLALERSMTDQAQVLARAEGLTGSAARQRVQDLIDTPTDAMLLRAIEDAEDAVFQNDNTLAKAAEGARRELGFVGTLIFPFTRTPANIVRKVVQFSPFGVLFTGSDIVRVMRKADPSGQAQRRLVDALGRAATGSAAALTAGWFLGKEGKISTHWPSDSKTSREWITSGKHANSILIGDTWRSLERISPLGNLILMGAHLYEVVQRAWKSDASLPSKLGGGVAESAAGTAKSLSEQTFLTGVRQLLDAIQNPEQDGLKYIQSLAASTVPAIIRRISTGLDPVIRDPGGSLLGGVKAALPGVSRQLEPRRDALARPRVRGSGSTGLRGVARQLFDPTNPSIDHLQEDEALRELVEMHALPGDPKQRSQETGQEYLRRWRLESVGVRRAVAAIMATPEYKNIEREVERAVAERDDLGPEDVEWITQELKKEILSSTIAQIRRDLRQ